MQVKRRERGEVKEQEQRNQRLASRKAKEQEGERVEDDDADQEEDDDDEDIPADEDDEESRRTRGERNMNNIRKKKRKSFSSDNDGRLGTTEEEGDGNEGEEFETTTRQNSFNESGRISRGRNISHNNHNGNNYFQGSTGARGTTVSEQRKKLIRDCCQLLGTEEFDLSDFVFGRDDGGEEEDGKERLTSSLSSSSSDEEVLLRLETPLLSKFILIDPPQQPSQQDTCNDYSNRRRSSALSFSSCLSAGYVNPNKQKQLAFLQNLLQSSLIGTTTTSSTESVKKGGARQQPNSQSSSVEITSLYSRDWVRVVELGLRFGRTIILASVDRVDISLLPLLQHQFYGSEGSRCWTFIGDKRVDVNPNFRLYLVSSSKDVLLPTSSLGREDKNADEGEEQQQQQQQGFKASNHRRHQKSSSSLSSCKSLFNLIDFSTGSPS